MVLADLAAPSQPGPVQVERLPAARPPLPIALEAIGTMFVFAAFVAAAVYL